MVSQIRKMRFFVSWVIGKPNAASMRGFVVEAQPQRKRRRRAWPC